MPSKMNASRRGSVLESSCRLDSIVTVWKPMPTFASKRTWLSDCMDPFASRTEVTWTSLTRTVSRWS